MPTAAEVAKVWVAPPSEYGPEPYFGMNGPVTIESLAKDLDTMNAMGFHAVTAQAGVTVDRRDVHLEEPIRSIGTHEVRVKLLHEVEPVITVEVVAEG